jgi:hypothetical protein
VCAFTLIALHTAVQCVRAVSTDLLMFGVLNLLLVFDADHLLLATCGCPTIQVNAYM